METTTETFPDNIEFTATLVGSGFGDDDWKRDANLWNVTLKFEGRAYRLDYWMGVGLVDHFDPGGRKLKNPHTYSGRTTTKPRPPGRDEVLGSLASDSMAGDGTFDDFCGEFGYDPDSRKAYATYEACREGMLAMRTLFGTSYTEFIERLWDA